MLVIRDEFRLIGLRQKRNIFSVALMSRGGISIDATSLNSHHATLASARFHAFHSITSISRMSLTAGKTRKKVACDTFQVTSGADQGMCVCGT